MGSMEDAMKRRTRKCMICDHPKRKRIDKAISDWESLPSRKNFGLEVMVREYLIPEVLDGEVINFRTIRRHMAHSK